MTFSNSLLSSRFNSLVDEAIDFVDESEIDAAEYENSAIDNELLANYSYTELKAIAPELVESLDDITRLELMKAEVSGLVAKYS